MGWLLKELKHAFAVGPSSTNEKKILPSSLERLAQAIVDRGMEIPAIILLETVRPLNFVTGQTMLAAWPLIKMARDWTDYREVAEALEDRRTLGDLAARIENLAGDRRAAP
ncbi:MAG: hypothetical protein GY854_18445 [Deltaproteobacteria bacterium]|nr:hypothetical protein [Deltaproteobacteria bacterium]